VAQSYGLYLEDAGITDRATVVIDAKGVVQHASSVTPSGKRDISELAALCEGIDAKHGAGLADFPAPEGLGPVEALYVKSHCGHSRKVLLALDNLHLRDQVEVRNVSDDSRALELLNKVTGKDQAPCLLLGGKPMHEADDIVSYFVKSTTDI
jgi:glutaredoxin